MHFLHVLLFHLRSLLRVALLHLLLALVAKVLLLRLLVLALLLRLQLTMLLVLTIHEVSLLLLLTCLLPVLLPRLRLGHFLPRRLCLAKRRGRLVSGKLTGMIQLSLGCLVGPSRFSSRNYV